MGERTNNIPPEFQVAVLDAIAQAQAKRAELEATGSLMDIKGVLKEAYVQLVAKMRAAGVPEDEFIPEHHFYMASGMTRILSWALAYSKEHPPTHRKGYGEAGYEEIASPDPVIFLHGGGGHGGPDPGPGGPDWPDPEEPPEIPDWGGPIPSQKHVVERIRSQYPSGPMDPETQGLFMLNLAREIGEVGDAGWAGLHLKNGGNRIPLPDGTTVDGDLILFQDGHMFDVLGSEETKSTATWLDEGFTFKVREVYYDVW